MGTGRMRRLEGSDLSSQCVDKTSWAAFDAVSTLCRPCLSISFQIFRPLTITLCTLGRCMAQLVRIQGVPAA